MRILRAWSGPKRLCPDRSTPGGILTNFTARFVRPTSPSTAKGAREIRRHHSIEKHLREDQRCRYEYFVKTDPVTRVKTHQVRGKDGKILTPFQLELEYPKFKDVQLVDIGEKLPFYDEFMAGADYMSSSSDNRARIQISVLCKFLPQHGDLDVLRNVWTDMGVVVNHQSLFMDFDWTKERLLVSIILNYFVTQKVSSWTLRPIGHSNYELFILCLFDLPPFVHGNDD